MKLLFIFLFLGVFRGAAEAVDNLRQPDVRSVGVGGNMVTQSVLFNPALIAERACKSIHIEYFNRYMLKELGTFSGSFYFPNPLLAAGVDISAFGFDKYREAMVRLALGKQLGERWSAGVAIHYSFLQSELLERGKSRLATDIGIIYKPLENLLTGVFIMNIPSLSLGDKSVEIDDFESYLMQIGFQWKIMNDLFIMGSLGANQSRSLTGNIGAEYQVLNAFFVRLGLRTMPLLPSLGVGYRFSRFAVDAAAIYHTVLGMCTGVGLSFHF